MEKQRVEVNEFKSSDYTHREFDRLHEGKFCNKWKVIPIFSLQNCGVEFHREGEMRAHNLHD